jgi:hypothetical protein
MTGPGGALNADRTWQAPCIEKGPAQQKLDLRIAAAKLVVSPTSDRVADRGIKSDKDVFSLQSTLHRRPHW